MTSKIYGPLSTHGPSAITVCYLMTQSTLSANTWTRQARILLDTSISSSSITSHQLQDAPSAPIGAAFHTLLDAMWTRHCNPL